MYWCTCSEIQCWWIPFLLTSSIVLHPSIFDCNYFIWILNSQRLCLFSHFSLLVALFTIALFYFDYLLHHYPWPYQYFYRITVLTSQSFFHRFNTIFDADIYSVSFPFAYNQSLSSLGFRMLWMFINVFVCWSIDMRFSIAR